MNTTWYYHKNCTGHLQEGFTLIELLLVIALITIMSVFSYPVGVSFLEQSHVEDVRAELLSALRKAQLQAIVQKNNSAYGVYIASDSYVLFEGVLYENRDASKDEVFSFPHAIAIEGIAEVYFRERTGEPSASGIITLTLRATQKEIRVMSHGLIE